MKHGQLSFHNIEDYLITIVDDGSDQASLLFYEKYKLDEDIRIILLARNYGHQVALLAGLENAKGDYILCLDLDLQDPIEIEFKCMKNVFQKKSTA